MNDVDIIQMVQDFLLNKIDFPYNLKDEIENNTGLRQYKLTVAYRTMQFWKYYKGNLISQNDFECSLRNFMLIFHTKIQINNYNIIQPNPFGMIQTNDFIYTNYDIPNYLISEFVKTVFMNNVKDIKNDSRYYLPTNPYVSNLTGFTEFKSVEQQLVVQGALKVPDGYTALIAMSTGGGKSLITQTIAYQYEESLTIVIVPTISLCMDQEKNSKKIINSDTENEIYAYYSGCDETKVLNAINKKNAKLLFISPEAVIKNKKIYNAIIKANECKYLKNLVIDEAHIVIEWGSFFRTDFQCLDAFRNKLLNENPKLRTFLLSATFSDDTVKQLKLFYGNNNKWIEFRLDKLRKETRYDIIKADSQSDKYKKLNEIINILPRPMIVYVKNPYDADSLQQHLKFIGYKNVRKFTGDTKSDEREKIINEWKENKFDLMIATCAFGVGVDKRDVRTVLHLYVPENPNKFYQECGRGGRDGLPCLSVLLYDKNDIDSARKLKEKVLTTEKFCGRWFSMLNSNSTKKINLLNQYNIDTSVIPTYNKEDRFESSDSNINWNVYCLLLLRRGNLISINDITFLKKNYIFTITIKNKEILNNTETAINLLNNIREEKNRISKDFDIMNKALQNINKTCISELFTEIYSYTEEYCAGCNAYKGTINNESIKLKLYNLNEPLTNIAKEINKLLGSSTEMIIWAKKEEINSLLNLLIENKINLIVIPDDLKNFYFEGIDNKTLLIITITEFRELCTNNDNYFISGSMAVYVENDLQFGYISDSIKRRKIKCIYIATNDMFIKKRNKNISEIVNGPCKNFYIVRKELNEKC